MIDLTVAGNVVDPRELEMHQQDEPFPGGLRYTLRIVDSELAEVVERDLPQPIKQILTRRQTIDLFNLLRPFISMRIGRRKSAFWANTVDCIEINHNTLELSGVCSPDASSV